MLSCIILHITQHCYHFTLLSISLHDSSYHECSGSIKLFYVFNILNHIHIYVYQDCNSLAEVMNYIITCSDPLRTIESTTQKMTHGNIQRCSVRASPALPCCRERLDNAAVDFAANCMAQFAFIVVQKYFYVWTTNDS